jgi:hypothetical protein
MTAVAGGPVQSADVTALAALTTGRPLVRLVQQATQSLADNTVTALTFGAGSEVFDTHGFHDVVTNNTRITPSVAGYYRAVGALWIPNATTTASMEARINKNGTVQQIGRTKPDTANAIGSSVTVECIVSMNGTTDYVELAGMQDDTGGTARSTSVSTGFSSTFELEFLRPL